MEGLIICLIITGAAGFLITISGIYMSQTGKGAFLTSGYSIMSKEKKDEYDSKAVCKFVGKFFMAIGLLTVLFAVFITFGIIYNLLIFWISVIIYCVSVTGSSIFLTINLNNGNRFRK